ncbi:MAG: PEP-CTERM sorting domain-containing protein, partial [Clostridia bacterium]|nr:PEP-CTERM sorting domain-containing protein [Clostridia bacterium]
SAVSSANGNVLLQGNAGLITFDNNSASFAGGAINTANGTVSLFGNTGGILFEDNNARDAGAAIFAGKGVNIEGNSSVTFRNHTLTNENASAPHGGGAIYNKSGDVTISGNGSVLFNTNKSQFAGGAIYAAGITQTNEDGSTSIQGGNVVMAGNGSVAFTNNSVVQNHQGGAIYADGSVTISGTETKAGTVTFTNNTAGGNGGAIYTKYGNIVMDGNSGVLFDTNVSNSGGAIFAENGNVSLTDNTTSISFNKNEALTGGGAAIYAAAGTVSLTDNGSVSFTYNTSKSHGGAISAISNAILMTGNDSLTFDNNKATDGHGGAVYSSKDISINNNGDVTFINNSAAFATVGTNSKDTFGGGAIFAANSLSLDGNGSITFSGNTSTAEVKAAENAEIVRTGGGAINAYGVSIRNTKGDIAFTGNKAAMSGGAIFNRCFGYRAETNMHISDNQGNILFSGNEAGRNGGAIDLGYEGSIAISGNKGTITFSDNKAANYGGAIYGNYTNGVHIENNGGEIKFQNNIAGAGAGAIYIHDAPSNLEATQYPSLALHIRNNGNVLFEKNAIKNSDGSYLLRSIAFGNSSTVMDETPIARLSAAAGNWIEFRDSINGHFHLSLNDDYEDTPQTGDIIFTGATTEDDLKTVKKACLGEDADITVTEKEIQDSRTSSVYGIVSVGGGRLRLENGVVLETNTISLKEKTGATLLVKNATVTGTSIDKKQGESNIIVNSGTTLQVEGPSDKDDRAFLMFALPEAEVGTSALNTTVGAVLDVDRLTLNGGSTLVMDKTSIDLAGGCLTLLTQGEEKINLVLTLDGTLMEESSVVLFSGVKTLDLGADMQYTEETKMFSASLFFTGSMIGEDTMVHFQNGMVSMTGLVTPMVPEPTTATLSLLALAALAARRRRK